MASMVKQKLSFINDGFCIFPGVLNKPTVARTRRIINSHLGKGMKDGRLNLTFGHGYEYKFEIPSLMKSIYDETRIPQIAAEFLGKRNVLRPSYLQSLTRFPAPLLPEKYSERHIYKDKEVPHIDGVYGGGFYNFSVFALLYLSDLDHTMMGNYTVWPGSHYEMSKYYLQNKPDPTLEGGVPSDFRFKRKRLNIKAKAGDLIWCHALCAHSGSVNLFSEPRHALIMRFHHRNDEKKGAANFGQLWEGWQGLVPLLGKKKK